MKTTKLTIGIVSIILAVLIFMQSAIAGLGNALAGEGETSGSFGALLAICYLVAGIMGIIGRKGGKVGYVSSGFYLVGGILGLIFAGTYNDLRIWGGLAIIFGIVFWIGTYSASNKELDEDLEIIPRTKKHPNFLERDYSFGWYLLAAFIVVGFADLFLNFSGLNILADLRGEPSTSQTTKIEQAQTSEAAETTEAPQNGNLVYDDGKERYEVTSYKVIHPGEVGNEYGQKPVIAFWYKATNLNKEGMSPMNFIGNFYAVQDNDPNRINELEVGSLPDDNFTDTQMEEIKIGGTVENAIAYELDDLETPVELIGGNRFASEKAVSKLYKIK